MIFERGIWRKRIAIVILLLLFIWNSNLTVYAEEWKELPRLIQTMSEQDEYEGLLHLGMLITKVTDTEEVEAAYQNVEASVVKVSAASIRGSGSIFELHDDKIILITSRHLFENAGTADEIEITFADQTQVTGKVLYLSEEYDVAFAEVWVKEVPIRTLKKLQQVRKSQLAADAVVPGSEMFHAGMLGTKEDAMRSGVVDNEWKYFVEFQSFMIDSFCAGRPGMSGGGTFDAYGNYIGMIVGGLEEKTASIPLSILMEEYDKIDF